MDQEINLRIVFSDGERLRFEIDENDVDAFYDILDVPINYNGESYTISETKIIKKELARTQKSRGSR